MLFNLSASRTAKTLRKGTLRVTGSWSGRDAMKASFDQCFDSRIAVLMSRRKLNWFSPWGCVPLSLCCHYHYNLWSSCQGYRPVCKWPWIFISVHKCSWTLFKGHWIVPRPCFRYRNCLFWNRKVSPSSSLDLIQDKIIYVKRRKYTFL